MRFVNTIIKNENVIRLINNEMSSYNKISFPLMTDEIIIQIGNKTAAVRKILLMNTCLILLTDNRINKDNTKENTENNKRWSAFMLIKLLSKERGINRMSAKKIKYVFLSEFNVNVSFLNFKL